VRGVEGLELGGRQIIEVAVESLVVMPVHPTQRRELDLLDRLPRPGAGRAADELGLVVAVDGFRQSVVKAVADGADRRGGADLGEPFAVADRGELRAGVAVATQIGVVVPRAQRAISIASRTIGVRM